ncbi:MAG: Emfourin [Thermoanaerobaculia bacterium]|jgi:hypothetical protein|nr:Emfourin [Thermoanaerobaculia bacterium]
MKISVRRSGGFGNIGASADADTSKLPSEKADALERLAGSASFPDQPPPPLRSAGADVYQYEITIDDGGGPKTYRADDLKIPDGWRSLVDAVLKKE